LNAFVVDQSVRRAFLALAATVGWLSLVLQLLRDVADAHASGQSALYAFGHFALFFTTTSNVLAAAVFTLAAMGGKYEPKPSVMAAVASFMVLVFAIFVLLLDGHKHRTGIAWYANTGLHYVMPLLAVVNWLVFTPRGELDWRQPFSWQIYPFGYFVYMLARGLLGGEYPYWFLDPAGVGWLHFFFSAAILLIVFWAMGEIFVGIDRLLARRSVRALQAV
jgi:hypothetical protein